MKERKKRDDEAVMYAIEETFRTHSIASKNEVNRWDPPLGSVFGRQCVRNGPQAPSCYVASLS